MKFGRRRPIAKGPRFKLGNYLKASFPSAPSVCDYSKDAAAQLSQMYLNDSLGDCVIAGIGHVVGTLTANAGAPFTYTPDQILALYEAIGGYNPNDPSSDRGCDELTALNYWSQQGAPVGSHQIAAWMEVDATNQAEVQAACWLFENLYFGCELPDPWVNPFPQDAGFTWDVAGDPNPGQGHCFIGCGYGPEGVRICTWGLLGTLTYAGVAKYATESAGGALYCVLSADAIETAKGIAPNGFDFSQLQADLDSMR